MVILKFRLVTRRTFCKQNIDRLIHNVYYIFVKGNLHSVMFV